MIERIEGMPAGTIGLRASGKLTKDDYVTVLEPILRGAVEAGDVRILFTLTDFDGLEPGAYLEDLKTGLGLGFGHHSAWTRMAFLTDVEWVGKAMRMFAWATPGEVMVGGLDEVEAATRWVAG